MPRYDNSNEPTWIMVPEGQMLVQKWTVIGFEIDPNAFIKCIGGFLEPLRMTSKVFDTLEQAQQYADSCSEAWQAVPMLVWVFQSKEE